MAEYVTVTEQVFTELREAILSGRLKAGEMHSVYRISDEMGVSRTPVREAVLKLADIDMVTIERNRGFTVRQVSVDEIREVFEMRLLLEVPAAAHAAAHGSPEFIDAVQAEIAHLHEASSRDDREQFMKHDLVLHDLITGVMANGRISATLRTLRESTRSRGVTTHDHSRGLSEIEDEHAPIVNALVARDSVAAGEFMRAHIVQTGMLLMRQVASVSGEAVPQQWARRIEPVYPDPASGANGRF